MGDLVLNFHWHKSCPKSWATAIWVFQLVHIGCWHALKKKSVKANLGLYNIMLNRQDALLWILDSQIAEIFLMNVQICVENSNEEPFSHSKQLDPLRNYLVVSEIISAISSCETFLKLINLGKQTSKSPLNMDKYVNLLLIPGWLQCNPTPFKLGLSLWSGGLMVVGNLKTNTRMHFYLLQILFAERIFASEYPFFCSTINNFSIEEKLLHTALDF